MPKKQNEKNNDSESQQILGRVKNEGGLFHFLTAPRSAEEHKQDEEEQNDPAIYWGKRVGRALGFLFLIYLVYSLLSKMQ